MQPSSSGSVERLPTADELRRMRITRDRANAASFEAWKRLLEDFVDRALALRAEPYTVTRLGQWVETYHLPWLKWVESGLSLPAARHLNYYYVTAPPLRQSGVTGPESQVPGLGFIHPSVIGGTHEHSTPYLPPLEWMEPEPIFDRWEVPPDALARWLSAHLLSLAS